MLCPIRIVNAGNLQICLPYSLLLPGVVQDIDPQGCEISRQEPGAGIIVIAIDEIHR